MSSSAASTEPNVESNEPEKLSAPLWKYVTKEAVIDVDGIVKIGEGNVPFVCNFCKKNFKGLHSRVKAHLLKILREGIKACTKVTAENMAEMQQLLESCEQQLRDKAPHKVLLPPSSNRRECDAAVARMFYTSGLSFNVAKNPHYRESYTLASKILGYERIENYSS
ncbi:hypothetical protein ACLB2K_007594 [Fragaria x ananassa]